jgi:hypothetical protein
VARQTLSLYFEPDRKVLPRRGELDPKGMSQVISMLAEAGAIKAPLPSPDRFLDPRYLRIIGVQ